MRGTNARSVVTALIAPLALVLTLGGCAPDPSTDDPTSGPTSSETPTDAGSPSTADDSPASPSATPPPDDDPTSTVTPPADEEVDEPGTEWQPPADPAAEGPTAAPDLPEVQGTLDMPIELPTDVVVSLADISTTTVEAETPGEYAGAAVVVTVHVLNDSTQAQDVGSAVVSLGADGGEVGVPTWSAPYSPLEGEVAAGETAEGTYVFMLDPANGRSVTVRVNYSAGEPLAVFAGQTS